MARAAAGSLGHRVWLVQLDEGEGPYVVCRLLWAVNRLAEEGRHPGDLKPGSLLVAAEGRIVLGDLNAATALNEHGRAAAFGGSGLLDARGSVPGRTYDVRAEFFSIGRCLDLLVDPAIVAGERAG